MASLVTPQVFFTGCTDVDFQEIERYLKYTKQEEFLEDINHAITAKVHPGLILCSIYAKMCYKSLVVGKNANISKVRSIQDNLKSCFEIGHGSIFEACNLNYLVTDCSRVYTHEQVRHRNGPPSDNPDAIDGAFPTSGWGYAQTSGRFCRLEDISLVWDPILDPAKSVFEECLGQIEIAVYRAECILGMRKPSPSHPDVSMDFWMNENGTYEIPEAKWVPDNSFDFNKRKQITSAIRRIAPNGQANEIGISCNVRSLRHVIQLRTARFAEREIRNIYHQIYCLTKAKLPLIFFDAKERIVDDLPEIYGMKQQPYDINESETLQGCSLDDLRKEVERRKVAIESWTEGK